MIGNTEKLKQFLGSVLRVGLRGTSRAWKH